MRTDHTSLQRWHLAGRNPFAALTLHRAWRRRIRIITLVLREAV